MCGSEKGLASPCGRGVGKAFRDADDVHGLTWEEEESASGKEQYASAGYSAKLIIGGDHRVYQKGKLRLLW